jgi:sulfur-carrier protein adenylyltransferase/sulfurtransferase
VYSMEGGIRAWKGLVAKGPPEAGVAFFPPGATGEELTALAWVLEDGSAFFYGSLAKQHPASPLFAELAGAEENHKRTLLQAYREIFGGTAEASFPGSILAAQGGEKTIEGGVSVGAALAWVQDKSLAEALEYCLALEVNSQDLYLKMEKTVQNQQAQTVFLRLAEEEKSHVNRLSALFAKHLVP